MEYTSKSIHQSKVAPGVHYELQRMSFGRRLELMTQVRELSRRREFLAAGESPMETMQVAELSLEIERLYFHWAVLGIQGLTIDGMEPSPAQVWERGPLALTNEILQEIHKSLEFTEEAQKNC